MIGDLLRQVRGMEQFVRDELRALPGRFAWWIDVASTTSSAQGASNVADGDRAHGRKLTIIAPFGLKSRPPAGVRGLVLHLLDNAGALLGVATSSYGPSDCDEGEVILHASATDTNIRLKPDGSIVVRNQQGATMRLAGADIEITPGAGGKVKIAGGGAAAARAGDAVHGGTVTATAGATPVTFSYIPDGGGAPVVNATLNLSGGRIAAGSADVEIGG